MASGGWLSQPRRDTELGDTGPRAGIVQALKRLGHCVGIVIVLCGLPRGELRQQIPDPRVNVWVRKINVPRFHVPGDCRHAGPLAAGRVDRYQTGDLVLESVDHRRPVCLILYQFLRARNALGHPPHCG